MSSLIISADFRLVLLEVAVRNLFMPWQDPLDQALMKKTVILFRMLDNEWISLSPNRRDCRPYRGSNCENENFHGGRSVLFSVPVATFEEKVSGVEVQLHVSKEVAKYFEAPTRRNFGIALVPVDELFNGIIKDLRERKDLHEYMTACLERQPISRSTCGVYPLMDEELREGEATIELYIRISYLGKCVITEIHSPYSIRRAFYGREETDSRYLYQFRELDREDLEGSWGSKTILCPYDARSLTCRCTEAKEEARRLLEEMQRRLAAEAARVALAAGGKGEDGDEEGDRERDKRNELLRLAMEREEMEKRKFEEAFSRVQELLALLKAFRQERGGSAGITGITEKPKKLPTQRAVLPCPAPCRYLPPCFDPCASVGACCRPTPCLITCRAPVRAQTCTSRMN